jgi:hypothetical protein
VGFVAVKVILGQVFSEYFGFPCQFSFHRPLHAHLLSFGAGTIGQLVADIPSGFSLTLSQETKMTTLSWNRKGVEFMQQGTTITSEVYCDLLLELVLPEFDRYLAIYTFEIRNSNFNIKRTSVRY